MRLMTERTMYTNNCSQEERKSINRLILAQIIEQIFIENSKGL